jgi:hypothetical protein
VTDQLQIAIVRGGRLSRISGWALEAPAQHDTILQACREMLAQLRTGQKLAHHPLMPGDLRILLGFPNMPSVEGAFTLGKAADVPILVGLYLPKSTGLQDAALGASLTGLIYGSLAWMPPEMQKDAEQSQSLLDDLLRRAPIIAAAQVPAYDGQSIAYKAVTWAIGFGTALAEERTERDTLAQEDVPTEEAEK